MWGPYKCGAFCDHMKPTQGPRVALDPGGIFGFILKNQELCYIVFLEDKKFPKIFERSYYPQRNCNGQIKSQNIQVKGRGMLNLCSFVCRRF